MKTTDSNQLNPGAKPVSQREFGKNFRGLTYILNKKGTFGCNGVASLDICMSIFNRLSREQKETLENDSNNLKRRSLNI